MHSADRHSAAAASPDHRTREPALVWCWRIPLKLAIFAVVTFFVLFPSPSQLARHISHLRDMQQMIAPDAPQLAGLEALVRERLTITAPADADSPPVVQRAVERVVLEKVEYAWDWDQWGSADYMPTVAEMFELAAADDGQLREDCDGRAVMAVSLMKRLGYEPTLVTDLRHVWVTTPQGAWMGPGGETTMASGEEGNEIAWGTLLSNIPTSLSFGVAVFPFVREFIILVTAYLLLIHRRMSRPAAAIGLVLLLQGLLFMRLGFFAPTAVTREASSWPAWVGLMHILAGFAVLIRASRRARIGISTVPVSAC